MYSETFPREARYRGEPIMRPSLLHPLRESRRSRRRPSRRAATRIEQVREPVPRTRDISVRRVDPAVRRVRNAGGPEDSASYTCMCGYLFSASVSATVLCPHCGTDQSW
jgi:hypothetical protein